ncbi:MAG: hypothetical protein ACRC92_02130 [Peptostreptococcaceae bacterium]
MLNWEIKKILRDRSSIIALMLMMVLFLQINFMKPMLETENEYWDKTKNEYVVDNRSEAEIANDKLKLKVDMIKSVNNLPDKDKSLASLSKEKLSLDNGNKYENVDFFKVFTYRLDFPLSIVIMLIIIVMLVSNLYTDEEVSNTSPIILSCKNRNKVLYSKLGIAIVTPILLYGLYICVTYLITYTQYGPPLNGNLQAYRLSDIAMLTKTMTINQYTLSKILTTTLMLLGISVVSMLISFLSDNSVKSIGLSVGFIAIGKILTLFRFLPMVLLTILSTGNYVDVTTGMASISGTYNGNVDILSKSVDISNLCLGIYGAIIVVGILGCIYSIKKVLVK